ncbi:MAG: PQQ-dependent sugar dehydrogenase [Bacillota bacterium]|nr:PQQ-dependent sugar dehydrogenase [Bacillota bacterium]
MKKHIKLFFGFVAIICICAVIFELHNNNKYNISFKINSIKYTLIYKGMNNIRDFTMDENGNYYAAYKDRIEFVDKNGKGYNILKDSGLNIYSIEYHDGKLYYSTLYKICSFDLKSKKTSTLIENIPNYGDYKNVLLKIKNGYLYASIGAATNSAVVGKDNSWLVQYPYGHDITPKKITLKGINFGDNKTGAFVPYSTSNIAGQIVTAHFPGNASVIIYNIHTGDCETFAWGIRNIKGMDFNNEGKLIATIGGMEDRGLRPVTGDSDYIYKIDKGKWYGWPDYSGGDPINSPKFSNGTKQKTLLDKHPTTNPPAPLYVYENLNTLGSLAVDNNNIFGDKSCIYFYVSKEKKIVELNSLGFISDFAFFPKDSNITSMKFINNKLYVIDSAKGYFIGIEKTKDASLIQLNSISVKYILLGVLSAIMGIVIILIKDRLQRVKKS